MDGVTILSQTDIYTQHINMIAFWIAAIITFVILSVFIMWGIYDCGEYAYALFFLLVAMVSALMGLCFGTLFKDTEYAYTNYKVTIDESVSMTEFYETYEVIDQEGLIFTVKEK